MKQSPNLSYLSDYFINSQRTGTEIILFLGRILWLYLEHHVLEQLIFFDYIYIQVDFIIIFFKISACEDRADHWQCLNSKILKRKRQSAGEFFWHHLSPTFLLFLLPPSLSSISRTCTPRHHSHYVCDVFLAFEKTLPYLQPTTEKRKNLRKTTAQKLSDQSLSYQVVEEQLNSLISEKQCHSLCTIFS